MLRRWYLTPYSGYVLQRTPYEGLSPLHMTASGTVASNIDDESDTQAVPSSKSQLVQMQHNLCRATAYCTSRHSEPSTARIPTVEVLEPRVSTFPTITESMEKTLRKWEKKRRTHSPAAQQRTADTGLQAVVSSPRQPFFPPVDSLCHIAWAPGRCL